MTGRIVTTKVLQEVTGYQTAADIARCLRDQGIKVFAGRNGPWTTVDLINLAGDTRLEPKHNETYSPDII